MAIYTIEYLLKINLPAIIAGKANHPTTMIAAFNKRRANFAGDDRRRRTVALHVDNSDLLVCANNCDSAGGDEVHEVSLGAHLHDDIISQVYFRLKMGYDTHYQVNRKLPEEVNIFQKLPAIEHYNFLQHTSFPACHAWTC